MVPNRTISLFELRALYFEKNSDINKKDAANTYRAFEYIFDVFPNIGTDTFDGECLESYQQYLASRNYKRDYCMKLVKFVRTVFNWGVQKKLVSPALAYELKLVKPIKYGRAEESNKRQAVPRTDVEKALPFFPPVIADMVRLQLLTALEKQWYVVQRRQGCLAVKTEFSTNASFSRPALRIFTGD
jgi:hypothetical protein